MKHEETLEQYEQCFKALSEQLATAPWFKQGRWIAKTHRFPEENPEGVTFHLFKKNWMNEDTRGIHFESYLDLKHPNTTYVTLHILHHTMIPNTKLKRAVISKPFVDEVAGMVGRWKGYRFRAGKYGMQPFVLSLAVSGETLVPVLFREFTRLCENLGGPLDRAIRTALNFT